ncbi:MAG: hypothetical protein JSS65_09055 [Armatimonadetes bacterium]|nr:hypothetical protein [Armatimonadota bacterium]
MPETQNKAAEAITESTTTRQWVLDYIRMILAFYVVANHLGFPIHLPSKTMVSLVLGNIFNGPAAVIVFFIISGYCIHLPFIRDRQLKLRQYFIRREVRIALPVLAVVLLALGLNRPESIGILWSIVCEEIYYLLYPLLLVVKRKWGWAPVWVFVLSLFVIGRLVTKNDSSGSFISGGLATTWMIGFPSWILGCVLAETVNLSEWFKKWTVSSALLWFLRFSVIGMAWLTSVLRFHAHMSNLDMLPVLGFLAVPWFLAEIRAKWGTKREVPAFFNMSFSLYLVHQLCVQILFILFPTTQGMVWVQYLGVFALTAMFYYLVEAPCHQLARRLGK